MRPRAPWWGAIMVEAAWYCALDLGDALWRIEAKVRRGWALGRARRVR
jgi:hypothetical protein